jgi:hypothetical protein
MSQGNKVRINTSAICTFLFSLFSAANVYSAETALDPGFSGKGITYGPRAEAIGAGTSSRDEEKDPDEEESGAFLYPALSVGVSTDDNINRTGLPELDDSATIYYLRPSIGIQGGKNNTRVNAGYDGDWAKYSGTRADDLYDYEDHHLYAGVTGYGRKMTYNITADYQRGHDSVSGYSIDDLAQRFDKWDRYALLASTDLGARGARINLRLDGLLEQKRQDVLKSLDYDTSALGAMLKLRIGGKTYGVLEGGVRRWDYLNSNSDADRYYGRLGVSWEATAKTKGLLTYGTEKYKPDNPDTPVTSTEIGPAFGNNVESRNSTWQGAIDWEVRRRDLIRFGTYQGSRNSEGIGSNSLSRRYTIGWTHDWSERIRSNLGYMVGTEDYKGTERKDDLMSYNLDLSYKFRRNMLLRGYYIYDDVESDNPIFTYDRNRAGLFFEWEY